MDTPTRLPSGFVEIVDALPPRIGDAVAAPSDRLLGRLSQDVDVAQRPIVSDAAVEALLAVGVRLDDIIGGTIPDQASRADAAYWKGRAETSGVLPAGWWVAGSYPVAARTEAAAAEALIERGVVRDTIVSFQARDADALIELERSVAGWVRTCARQFDAAGVQPLQATDPHGVDPLSVCVFLRAPYLTTPTKGAEASWFRLHESGSDLIRRYTLLEHGAWESTGPSYDVGHLSWATDGTTPIISRTVADVFTAAGITGCELRQIDDDAWAIAVGGRPAPLDWRRARPVQFRGAPTSELIGLPARTDDLNGVDVALTEEGDLLLSNRGVRALADARVFDLAEDGDDPPTKSLYAVALDRVRTRRTAPQLAAAGITPPNYLWLREPAESRPAHLG